MGLFVSYALPGDPEHSLPVAELFHKQGRSSPAWPTLPDSLAPLQARAASQEGQVVRVL